MKVKFTLLAVVTGLLLGAMATTVLAQNGPGPRQGGGNGRGYGGPPKTEQERAARQAACLEKNGGVCPNGGPRAECPYGGPQGNCQLGKGQGKGAGKGAGRGLRDGTGPRAGTGTCPFNNGAQAQK